MTELLCCTAEIGTMLQIKYTLIKEEKKERGQRYQGKWESEPRAASMLSPLSHSIGQSKSNGQTQDQRWWGGKTGAVSLVEGVPK